MIRRLSEADHQLCISMLKKQAAENLFIIGDVEAFGYDQDFQKLWGEFDENGDLIAVLLKYEENYIPYATRDFDAKGFAKIISSDPTFLMMSGLKAITEKIEPFITRTLKRKRETYYAKCTQLTNTYGDESDVQQAKPTDAEALVEMLVAIPEFSDSPINVESKRRNLEKGISRSFFIVENEKIVSTASTAAENSLSAMVVGVATLEGYKKKGYASKSMFKLCQTLLAEGKELCLFYDNPEAGVIYKRIGFQDIGIWMMYTYEKQ